MKTSSIRTRWAAIGAAVAISLGAGGIGIGHATTSSGERPVFIPIEPCRLADIRPDTIGPDGSRDFDGWGTTGACTLPTGTSGLALNVTAVGATQQTNLRFHPQGTPTPETANLNPTPGASPTPNAVNVSLNDANGKFTVFNRFGNVAVVIDVMGYYDDHNHDDRYYTETETDASLAQLHQRIATLEAKLASVSATTVDGRPTVRFTGVNVQILDGTGATFCAETAFPEPCNGLGNLIVGYNESDADDERTGSHNVVVGTSHEWTDYSGLVTGTNNEIRDRAAVAIGGFSNIASGNGAVAVGGQFNNSSGSYTVATGGIDNVASVTRATVTGGRSNVAGGTDAAISGGNQNVVSGNRTVVLGGEGCSQFTQDGVFYGSPGGTVCTQLN